MGTWTIKSSIQTPSDNTILPSKVGTKMQNAIAASHLAFLDVSILFSLSLRPPPSERDNQPIITKL